MVKNKDGGENRKWGFLLGGLGVVILGLVIGIVVVLSKGRLVLNTPDEALAYLVNFGNADNIEPYIEAANRALDAATNDDVRAEIYSMRAGVIFNYSGDDQGNYYGQMLSDAYNAEEIKHSDETAYIISICEGKVGNDEKSKEFFEIAKERGYFDIPGKG